MLKSFSESFGQAKAVFGQIYEYAIPFLTWLYDNLATYLTLLSSSEHQSLIHTDLTSYNLMMEGSSTPDNELSQDETLYFIDMQTTIRGNPLVDLGFIIHYAADSEGF